MSNERSTLILAAMAGALVTGLVVASWPLAPATAQSDGPSGDAEPITTKDISLEQARQAVYAAYEKADEIGEQMNIAVVDSGANLKAFARMDGAWLGSIDIAMKKAKTSRLFDMPTGALGELSQPGGSLYQIEESNEGLITFPGGVPIKAADGTVIGAIGVSGSTVENDHAVATAGAEAIMGQD
jgi:uncharacterized protein GlcG (DUF336 family)